MEKEQNRNENDRKNRPSGHIARWQIVAGLLMLFDVAAICASYFIALWLRYDLQYSMIAARYLQAYRSFILPFALLCVIGFHFLGMYRSIWAFAGLNLLTKCLLVFGGAGILHAFGITLFYARMPMSYYVFGLILQTILMTGVRFLNRVRIYLRHRWSRNQAEGKRIMLIGAGDAGQAIFRDISQGKEGDRVVCIIDDNPNKWNRDFSGVPVVGGRDEILHAVEKYKVDQIFLTMPSAPEEAKRDILNICSETDCSVRTLPGMYQLVKGDLTVSALKEVSVEDLLGREPIKTDMSGVFRCIRDKVILVTGGGGSIGSELCRQIAEHQPKRLIIFDVYENNAYAIQMELKRTHPELDLVTLIGSVRDSRRIFQVFEQYHPQIVYHAAAHKHVPLMEDSPCEAIKNNVIGTYKTAYAAIVHHTERFVLISTDKAVNPTNVMGASKRLCEMVIQSLDRKIKAGKASEIPELFTHPDKKRATGTEPQHHPIPSEELDTAPAQQLTPGAEQPNTEFVAVRFGNVLGSNGSVIPLFKRQIEQGGPVTVTHPDIVRYFMTIPEAVSLVLVAGTYAAGGEIYVLDMGSPVKIVNLARNLIRKSGLKPDVDIKIEYTGLRPGEKLYEEKLMAEEGLRSTENHLIHIANPIPMDEDRLFKDLRSLMDAAYANREADTRILLMQAVPTYHQEYA